MTSTLVTAALSSACSAGLVLTEAVTTVAAAATIILLLLLLLFLLLLCQSLVASMKMMGKRAKEQTNQTPVYEVVHIPPPPTICLFLLFMELRILFFLVICVTRITWFESLIDNENSKEGLMTSTRSGVVEYGMG